MSIDFTLDPELEALRTRVRTFMTDVVAPAEVGVSFDREDPESRTELIRTIVQLRQKAQAEGLWCPHMPPDYGGMGLGPVALAAVSAEAARTSLGPFAINCQAPDEGNMHTLLHFGTQEQKETFLRPLCDGYMRSCFAMTEPEVAGSDPTLIRTTAVEDGDDWVIDGHKWFISGARGATFAIVIAKTDPEAEPPQARNTAFIVEMNAPGLEIVRDIETMSGASHHSELRFHSVRVPAAAMLGGRGEGHKLGQVRLGPARLAHCMRWIGQTETALGMLVDRAGKRFAHGSLLADKQAIQWMMSDSAIELYQAKLMVLHAAYLIENGRPFKQEVSMAKYHVANTLWRVVDRAIQVHGALGYSKDTPLAAMLLNARWARFADGADEVHMMRIAQNVIDGYAADGDTRRATGDLPL